MRTKNHASHGWFRLWIIFGLGVAILLLVNSMSNYLFVSRRVLVDQVRRDLSGQVAAIDRQAQQYRLQSPSQLAALVEKARQSSNGRIAWIQLHGTDDTALASTGLSVPRTFSASYIRSQLRNRQPIVKTLSSRAGSVVVEAFPFRLPTVTTPALFRTISDQGQSGLLHRFAIIEIAVFLEGGGSLWPLQRNLLINSFAALVLLVSLVIIGLRFRDLEGGQLEQ